jgi:DNA-binding CsgD family transcriptional regulator
MCIAAAQSHPKRPAATLRNRGEEKAWPRRAETKAPVVSVRRPLNSGVEAPLQTCEREPSLTDSRTQARLLKLHAAVDVTSFWTAAQALLRETVPHNSIIAYLDYLDHPKTWKAARILASTNARMPAEWFEERWKLDITPPYLQSHYGIKCFKFSDIIQNSSEFQRTAYFNQFFKPFGWHHTACLSFWNTAGINSVIALRRTKEQGDYRAGEIDFLKNVQPHFNTVLRRLGPAHKDQTKLRWLMESTEDIPTALMFLDWNLAPVYLNREAYGQCAIWNFGAQSARAYNAREVYKLPDDMARVCTELKGEWLRFDDGQGSGKISPLSAKILNPTDSGRSATISIATGGRESLCKPGFRIRFEQCGPASPQSADLQQSTLLWRLTTAERDLVQLASKGCNNAEIASKLSKSVNTVKHQFTSIYSKLGMDRPKNRFISRAAGSTASSCVA